MRELILTYRRNIFLFSPSINGKDYPNMSSLYLSCVYGFKYCGYRRVSVRLRTIAHAGKYSNNYDCVHLSFGPKLLYY